MGITVCYNVNEGDMKKVHKPDLFEEQLLSFLERREGKTLTRELIGEFAVFLWRKKTEFELRIMRAMLHT